MKKSVMMKAAHKIAKEIVYKTKELLNRIIIRYEIRLERC